MGFYFADHYNQASLRQPLPEFFLNSLIPVKKTALLGAYYFPDARLHLTLAASGVYAEIKHGYIQLVLRARGSDTFWPDFIVSGLYQPQAKGKERNGYSRLLVEFPDAGKEKDGSDVWPYLDGSGSREDDIADIFAQEESAVHILNTQSPIADHSRFVEKYKADCLAQRNRLASINEHVTNYYHYTESSNA